MCVSDSSVVVMHRSLCSVVYVLDDEAYIMYICMFAEESLMKCLVEVWELFFLCVGVVLI